MPRMNRSEFSDGLFHVTTRGVEGVRAFRDDLDRAFFLKLLAANARRSNWRVEAFCLMGTHYHLVLSTFVAKLSAGMHRLNGDYARAFNRRHGRRGHLWAARYSSWVIEGDEYLENTVRYVLLNPVRAGLCRTPEEWRWSGSRSGLVA
jgi:REP-associated tyrosine transposase